MLVEAMEFMAEEVALDGSKGTSPARFLTHFLNPSNPVYSPTLSHKLEPPETFDVPDHPVGPSPSHFNPASIASPAGEAYAAYVWKSLVEGKGGFRVLLKDEGPSRGLGKSKVDGQADTDSAGMGTTVTGGRPSQEVPERSLPRSLLVAKHQAALSNKRAKAQQRTRGINGLEEEPETEAVGVMQVDDSTALEEEAIAIALEEEAIDPSLLEGCLDPALAESPRFRGREDDIVALDPNFPDEPTVGAAPGTGRSADGKFNIVEVLPKNQRYRLSDMRRTTTGASGRESSTDTAVRGGLTSSAHMASTPALCDQVAGDQLARVLDKYEAGDFMELLRKERDGAKVVIRASAERSMNAIIGAHAIPRTITSSIHLLLEEISRSRGLGLSTIQVGTWARVDQGTAFYMIRVLLESGLIAKLPTMDELKDGARVTNLVVHRRFLHQNPEYQLRLASLKVAGHDVTMTPGYMSLDGVDAHEDGNAEAGPSNYVDQTEEAEDEPLLTAAPIGEDPETGIPIFTPCGPMEITSYAFVRDRLRAILKAPKLLNHFLLNRDIISAIGFVGTIITRDRRTLNRHVRRLIHREVIDLVLIPSEDPDCAPYRCLRLAEFRDVRTGHGEFDERQHSLAQMVDLLGEDEPAELVAEDREDEFGFQDSHVIPFSRVELNEYRLFSKVLASGSQGCTYAGLSEECHNLDKKVLEVMLQRYDVNAGSRLPPHLAHYTIVTSTESDGRLKFLRAYTLQGYLQLCAQRGRPPNPQYPTSLPSEVRHLPSLLEIARYNELLELRYHIQSFPYRPSRFEVFQQWQAVVFPRDQDGVDIFSDQENAGLAKAAGEPVKLLVTNPSKAKPRVEKIIRDKAILRLDAAGNIAVGRPRKFVRMLGLDGQLVRRTEATIVPVHPDLPASLLYNTATGVFFDVPSDYTGGAVSKPETWDTATEPTVVYLPGTQTRPGTRSGKKKKRAEKEKLGIEEKEDMARIDMARIKAEKALLKDQKRALRLEAQEQKALAKRLRAESSITSMKGKRKRSPDSAVGEGSTIGPSAENACAGDTMDIEVEEPSAASPNAGCPPIKRPRNGLSHPLSLSNADETASLLPNAVPHTQLAATDAERQSEETSLVLDVNAMANASPGLPAMELATVLDAWPSASPYPIQDDLAGPHGVAVDQAAIAKRAQGIEDGPLSSRSQEVQEIPQPERSPDLQTCPMQPATNDASLAQMPGSATAPDVRHDASELVATARSAKKRRVQKSEKGAIERLELNETKNENILQFLHENGKVSGSEMMLSAALYKWQCLRAGTSDNIRQLARPTVRKHARILIDAGKLRERTYAVQDDFGKTHQVDIVFLTGATDSEIDRYVDDERLRRSRLPETHRAKAPPPGTGQFARVSVAKEQTRSLERRIPSDLPAEVLGNLPIEEARIIFGNDWRITAQLYGFVGGIVARASDLHAFAVDYAREQPFAKCNDGVLVPVRFFIDELPVSIMARSIAVGKYDTALEELIRDPVRGLLPMSSPRVRAHLRIFREGRCRILRLLSFLLQEQAARLCNVLRSNTSALLEPQLDWDVNDLKVATHIHFRSSMPVYASAPGVEGERLIAIVPTRNGEEIAHGWHQIWLTAGLQTPLIRNKVIERLRMSYPIGTGGRGVFADHRQGVCELANPKVWARAYVLAPAQKTYLRSLVNLEEAESPLTHGNPDVMAQIARRIMAPEEVIKKYFTRLMLGKQKRSDLIPVRPIRRTVSRRTTRTVSRAAVIASLKQKLQLRQEGLGLKWSEDLHAVLHQLGKASNPELLRYLEPLRSEYVRGRRTFKRTQLSTVVKAHFDKFQAIREQEAKARSIRPSATALQIVHHLNARAPKTRLRWTPEMEELARDGFVIIEHRVHLLKDASEQSKRYEAYLQLMPGHPRVKQIRDRIIRWRREDANNNYLENLADSWAALYEQYKGKDVLPDPHPNSVSGFPIADWVVFLRQNVRKGLLTRIRPIGTERRQPILPRSTNDLQSCYNIAPKPDPQETVEQLYWRRHVSDERKIRATHLDSVLLDRIPTTDTSVHTVEPEERAFATAAIKMVIGTSLENFDVAKAGSFLAPFRKEVVAIAIEALERDKIIGPAERPGDFGPEYSYGESNAREMARPYTLGLQMDAEHVVDALADSYCDWPANTQSGDFAGFLALVSEDLIDCNVDSSEILGNIDEKHGVNTREIDDDMIEPVMAIRRQDKSEMPYSKVAMMHGTIACSESRRSAHSDGVHARVLASILSAGPGGARIDGLQIAITIPRSELLQIIRTFLQQDPAPISLIGYDYPTLVDSRTRTGHRAVPCARSDLVDQAPSVAPRQWCDIYGNLLGDVWSEAVKVVRGHVIQRPGISERSIRELIQPLFDRLEINDLLQYCMDEEQLYRAFADEEVESESGGVIIGLADPSLEDAICYFPDPLW